jgi:hypothetical protein
MGTGVSPVLLEKKQDSLWSVPVRVIWTADLMNNVMAECHISERSGLAGRSEFPFDVLKDFWIF